MGWTIRHHGTAYEVVVGDERRTATLTADGEEVDTRTAEFWEAATLRHGDVEVRVQWGPRNTVTAADLVLDEQTTPLVPPPGSRAARREAFAREHPTRFVLRRVGVAAAEIVIGFLGVSAIVSAFVGGLLPRIDLSWIPRPSAPAWLRYVDPFYWLERLGLSWPDVPWPDVSLPGWLDPVLASTKYWVPLLVAAGIGLNELDKRRKRDAEREEAARADQEREDPGEDA